MKQIKNKDWQNFKAEKGKGTRATAGYRSFYLQGNRLFCREDCPTLP